MFKVYFQFSSIDELWYPSVCAISDADSLTFSILCVVDLGSNIEGFFWAIFNKNISLICVTLFFYLL